MKTDPFESFKAAQKLGWAHFAPLEALTTPAAARLVNHARIHAGQKVLDVGCGTGVVAVTAARHGARVTAVDLTPELLERARQNAQVGGFQIDWHEGDVEQLPFEDAAFDVVLSQFAHIFGPRPEVAIAEMLRVLKPGGTIAFSTWPPELYVGRMFLVTARYSPPPPPGAAPPPEWGDPRIILQRLGDAVDEVVFDRATILLPALSPSHARAMAERTVGPVRKLVDTLRAENSAKLEAFRAEYDSLTSEYFQDNTVRQDYLLTRAKKL